MCSESLVLFNQNTAKGVNEINWQTGTMMTDYFYKGSTEFQMKKHKVTGARGL